jgi:hypothetical protein
MTSGSGILKEASTRTERQETAQEEWRLFRLFLAFVLTGTLQWIRILFFVLLFVVRTRTVLIWDRYHSTIFRRKNVCHAKMRLQSIRSFITENWFKWIGVSNAARDENRMIGSTVCILKTVDRVERGTCKRANNVRTRSLWNMSKSKHDDELYRKALHVLVHHLGDAKVLVRQKSVCSKSLVRASVEVKAGRKRGTNTCSALELESVGMKVEPEASRETERQVYEAKSGANQGKLMNF